MESIYSFRHYRKFIKAIFATRERHGYGQATKLAEHLKVHGTFVSQVLKGEKGFGPEHAVSVAGFLNLNPDETEYFVLLCQLDRAGTQEYREYTEARLAERRERAEQLVNRVEHETRLRHEDRARFYSDWIYAAIQLATMVPGLQTPSAIAERLSLPPAKVAEAVEFLLLAGILRLEKGSLGPGHLTSHLERSDPWIKSHHAVWREKALEDISRDDGKSLHYSAPMTMSKADFTRIRELLIKSINQIDGILEPSASEDLVCLNIDWFRVR